MARKIVIKEARLLCPGIFNLDDSSDKSDLGGEDPWIRNGNPLQHCHLENGAEKTKPESWSMGRKGGLKLADQLSLSRAIERA